MGFLSGIVSVLTEPIGVLTGVAFAYFWLDLKPGRVGLAFMFLAAFLWIAWGANFQVDWERGNYNHYFQKEDFVYGTRFHMVKYVDDKPAKLRLELIRFTCMIPWACLIRYGWPALMKRFRKAG